MIANCGKKNYKTNAISINKITKLNTFLITKKEAQSFLIYMNIYSAFSGDSLFTSEDSWVLSVVVSASVIISSS